MEDIFEKEGYVIVDADNKLQSKAFTSTADEELFSQLLDDYKRLLKQMRSMVRISDMMQSKLNALSGELEKLSQIDGLTGLYNRRFFNETYQKEWDKAADSKSPLGVLMIDIDFFKKYNDTFGHLEGDKCLQNIANSIENTVKGQGQNTIVGRFGGEEFVVVLQYSEFNHCTEIAEKILENIDLLNIPSGLGASHSKVSVSIGIGYKTPEHDVKPETLINIADQALYRAKNDGRRCYRS